MLLSQKWMAVLRPALLVLCFAHSGLLWAEPVTAQFVTTYCATPCDDARTLQWWLLRDAEMVEMRTMQPQGQLANHSSVWALRGQNKIYYTYVLHAEKRAIQYTPVDLNLLGLATDQQTWAQKRFMITPAELQRLTRIETDASAFGEALQQYEGHLANGTAVTVRWLPKAQLPVEVVYRYPQHTVHVRLQRLLPETPTAQREMAPTKPAANANEVPQMTDAQVLSQYQLVDYTDLGDMEHQPDDLAWLAHAVGAPGVHGHAHAHASSHAHP